MKADPCVSPTCFALNLRPDGSPIPERCPRCDGPLLRPSPPSAVDRQRRLSDLVWLVRQGENADWAVRRAIKDLALEQEDEA